MARPDQYELVLAQMAKHGANLTKPAHVLFYLYFSSLDRAKAATEQLQSEGYQAESTRIPPTSLRQRLFGPKIFSCVAETNMVPSEANLSKAIDQMEAVAAKHSGEYDGWEASIEQ